MERKVTSVLLAGVGGQGTLLASQILSQVMVESGYDVKVSEVHGMSQRGGDVQSQVRFGEKVYSPVIPEGGADYVVAFELLEAVRCLKWLSPGGRLIVNIQRILPLPVLMGKQEYPSGIEKSLKKNYPDATVVDAVEMARQAGHPKAVNLVLLGLLAQKLPVTLATWKKVIKKRVPPKTAEINLRAFDLGMKAANS